MLSYAPNNLGFGFYTTNLESENKLFLNVRTFTYFYIGILEILRYYNFCLMDIFESIKSARYNMSNLQSY